MQNTDRNKLYKVTLQGLQHYTGSYAPDGIQYVVAKHPTEAYEKAIKYISEENIGFDFDRNLQSIELIAEEYQHTTVPFRLIL